MQVPQPIRIFWRDKVAVRPIASGAVAAAVTGMAAGLYLAAGNGFERPPMEPVPAAARRMEPAPQPITFMKDADGNTPDWVIGTDNIPGRDPPARTPVLTVPDPDDEPAARAGRGLGWFLQPWRWGRSDDRDDVSPPPGRRPDSDRAEQRRAQRERSERYAEAQIEEDMARDGEDWRQPQPRYEPDYRGRYQPRYEPSYEPRPAPRPEPRYDPRYDPRDAESEEAPYPFVQAPPPRERWR